MLDAAPHPVVQTGLYMFGLLLGYVLVTPPDELARAWKDLWRRMRD